MQEAIYPFKKSEVRAYNGNKGNTQVIIENPYESKIPTRFLLGMIDADSYIGNYYYYYHNSIKKFVQKFSNKYVTVLRCRLQPINSSLCGHYCLYYAYCRYQGMTKKIL